jgi:rfaE bifunctional protein kinase chain/domain
MIDLWLTKERLAEILAACQDLRVGVLGDFCLDAYFYVDMARAQLSREAPLFNHPVVRESYSLGGAANVAWNLADLGVKKVLALTVMGEDWRAALLKDCLRAAHIRLEAVLAENGRFTPCYGKVVLMGPHVQQEDARLDFVNTAPLKVETEEALIGCLETWLPELDALVVADYQVMGIVTERVLAALNELSRRFPRVTFSVDSRERIGHFRGMVLKPNDLEAFQAAFPEGDPGHITEEDLLTAGRNLQQIAGKPVFLTRGERGCMLFDMKEISTFPAVVKEGPIDPVGAGDTYISALTAGLAAGAGPREAGALASLAAGVSLKKLHVTGTASPREIFQLYEKLVRSERHMA